MFNSRCCNAKTIIMSTRDRMPSGEMGTFRIRKCTKCDKIFWTEETFYYEPEHKKLNKKMLDDLRELSASDDFGKLGKQTIKFNFKLNK